MSKLYFFPQPEALQERYYNIQREYAHDNPTLYGYLRRAPEVSGADHDEFLAHYRRTHPNVRYSTMIQEAEKEYQELLKRQMGVLDAEPPIPDVENW